jgi:hypothetical protein
MKQAIEYLVTLQVHRLLQPAGLHARYLGTESRYDIAIRTLDDAMVGVAEITRDAEDAHEAYLASMVQAGNSLPLPAGWGSWAVTLDRRRQIRSLREEITEIVEVARSIGRKELSPDRDWPQLPVHSRMREIGVGDLTRVVGEGDRCDFVGPFHGGLIDGSPGLLNEYIEDALKRPQVVKRLVKLSEALAGTRDLVLIPGRPQDHHSMTYRMNGWSQWPGTPTNGPTIPVDLTGVWIVQPEVGHVVAWRANTGWLYGSPQGGGWWREFQDSPELQVLFEEVGE